MAAPSLFKRVLLSETSHYMACFPCIKKSMEDDKAHFFQNF